MGSLVDIWMFSCILTGAALGVHRMRKVSRETASRGYHERDTEEKVLDVMLGVMGALLGAAGGLLAGGVGLLVSDVLGAVT